MVASYRIANASSCNSRRLTAHAPLAFADFWKGLQRLQVEKRTTLEGGFSSLSSPMERPEYPFAEVDKSVAIPAASCWTPYWLPQL